MVHGQGKKVAAGAAAPKADVKSKRPRKMSIVADGTMERSANPSAGRTMKRFVSRLEPPRAPVSP